MLYVASLKKATMLIMLTTLQTTCPYDGLHTILPRDQLVPPNAGPIKLYNAYQSSTYNAWTNPAEAAIDGNIYTSSQTAVDTASCKALNDQGQYGACGVMSECMTSPYFTGAYASTPSNPYWTAGFSSDISVSYRIAPYEYVSA